VTKHPDSGEKPFSEAGGGKKGPAPLKPLLITIDGPAGAGKTTLSKRLAACLGYRYVDTGALYRAVAHEALRAGIPTGDDAALKRLCETLELTLVESVKGLRILCDGRDITDGLRTPEMAMAASAASAQPSVRAYLLDIQRRMGKEKRCVFEGRDMGTVVFPAADIKFFLDAEPDIRALRRFREMQHPSDMTLNAMKAAIRSRDRADSTRALAPLAAAPDAIRIDSTSLSETEVLEYMLERVRRKGSIA